MPRRRAPRAWRRALTDLTRSPPSSAACAGRRVARWSLLCAVASAGAPAAALSIPTTGNRSGPRYGGWLGVGLLIASLAVVALVVAWLVRRESRSSKGELIRLMREARALVMRPDNVFMRSGWDDTADARAEVDAVLRELRTGGLPASRIGFLFLPAGPMQELSLDSGWGDEYADLANRLDAALAAASPPAATAPVGARASEAHFACATCGARAGTVRLEGPDVHRESFTGTLAQAAPPGTAEAVAAADTAVLHALEAELTPFYCPECALSYCGDHWARWDVFDDDAPDHRHSIRGRCPAGHERMLED